MSSMTSWFVQTGFGATLGPMPDDALREMVRTGALVPEDQVREGLTGEWRSTSAIVGLFETPASPTLAAMTLDEIVDDSSSRRPSDSEVAASMPESSASAVFATRVSPNADDLIAAWKSERGRSEERVVPVSLASMIRSVTPDELPPELPEERTLQTLCRNLVGMEGSAR